jgi:hypothetical protein
MIWFTLGALFFLSSCQESTYMPQVYQPTEQSTKIQQQLQPVEPTISYSNEIDVFYNNDFKLTFEEDLEAFYSKVDTYAEHKASSDKMLSAANLYRALNVVNEPRPLEDISKVNHVAARIRQSY